MYSAVLLNVLWQPCPLYIIYIELKADDLSKLLTCGELCQQDRISNCYRLTLTKKQSPQTGTHIAMHQYRIQFLQVSCEGIQLEDVNNGWHQRPVRPYTPFTISSESWEPHSDPWEQCWNKYWRLPEVLY